MVNKKYSGKSGNNQTEIEEKTIRTVLCIPYFGTDSINFAKKLKKLFKSYYDVDLQCVYKSFKVRNYFSLKCATPFILRSNVVYSFNGLCDTDISYIGKTKRHLAVRMDEHISGKSPSAVSYHVNNCNICKNCNSSSFKILDTGANNLDTSIKEALYIKKLRPRLNDKLASNGQSFYLNVF